MLRVIFKRVRNGDGDMQLWITIAYGIILVACAVALMLVNRQKPGKEQQIMQMMICFTGITMMGYFFEIEASTLEGLVIAQKLIYVGFCQLYYFMLLFYLKYCHIRLNSKVKAGLIAINSMMTLITFTFDKHKLFYRSYRVVENSGYYVLDKEYGVFHSFYVAEVLLYSLAMILIAVWHINSNQKNRNVQSLHLISVALCPATLYMVEKIFDLSFDLVPFGIMLGLVLIMYLIYGENIYDLHNVAKEYVFSSIDAALIVVDAENRYKGSNILAMHMFPELRNAVMDEDIMLLSARMCDIVEGNIEETIYKERIYEINIRTIEQKKQPIGMVIWLSDVTDQRRYLRFMESYQRKLKEEVSRKTMDLQKIQEEILMGFANIIESRDHITGGHVKRTSGYVNILVNSIKDKKEFAEFNDEEFAKHICLAAPLHDIGKIGIPDKVLNKKGEFNQEEFEIMKTHTYMGSAILDTILSSLEDKEYCELAKEMAEYHHEKWDGSGYPNGIKGEEIPICARIMAVADVFDALTSERPYKEAFSMDKAFQIIEDGRGTQFDPQIVDAFVAVKDEILKFHQENKRAEIRG